MPDFRGPGLFLSSGLIGRPGDVVRLQSGARPFSILEAVSCQTGYGGQGTELGG